MAGCVSTGMTEPVAIDPATKTVLQSPQVSDQLSGRLTHQYAPRMQPDLNGKLTPGDKVDLGPTLKPFKNPTREQIQAWIADGVVADHIVIQKKPKLLTLWSNGNIIKVYNIRAFGADPVGHKMREGDEKTPEGYYTIDTKHVSEKFQKFMRISYPNKADKALAKSLGFSPGGQVGIHGDEGGFKGFMRRFDPNWTNGCITLRNADLEEVWSFVQKGTPITIRPN